MLPAPEGTHFICDNFCFELELRIPKRSHKRERERSGRKLRETRTTVSVRIPLTKLNRYSLDLSTEDTHLYWLLHHPLCLLCLCSGNLTNSKVPLQVACRLEAHL